MAGPHREGERDGRLDLITGAKALRAREQAGQIETCPISAAMKPWLHVPFPRHPPSRWALRRTPVVDSLLQKCVRMLQRERASHPEPLPGDAGIAFTAAGPMLGFGVHVPFSCHPLLAPPALLTSI